MILTAESGDHRASVLSIDDRDSWTGPLDNERPRRSEVFSIRSRPDGDDVAGRRCAHCAADGWIATSRAILRDAQGLTGRIRRERPLGSEQQQRREYK